MGQEWELKAVDWGSGLDSLVFSAGDNAIVFETNVEPFVQVESLEPSSKTESDFVPLDGVHVSGVPLPPLDRSRGLNEDLVAN